MSSLLITDQRTAKRALTERILGFGVTADAAYVYFVKMAEKTPTVFRVPAAAPETVPAKVAGCECGTEGSPYVWAVSGEKTLCFLIEDSPSALHFHAPGVEPADDCILPSGAWKRAGATYQVELKRLTPACRALLTATSFGGNSDVGHGAPPARPAPRGR